MRSVHLSPRLQAALDMVADSDCVADIGCDHGRVSVALLQQGKCSRVIATDISAPSLNKARELADYVGLGDRIETREGNGFSNIASGECQTAMILGMGGQVISAILDGCDTTGLGVTKIIMQPMRGQAELRQYLYENCYHILEDKVVREGRRYYQVFSAVRYKDRQSIMDGWPEGCFEVGFLPCCRKDKSYKELLLEYQRRYSAQLDKAKNTYGEAKMQKKLKDITTIIGLMED